MHLQLQDRDKRIKKVGTKKNKKGYRFYRSMVFHKDPFIRRNTCSFRVDGTQNLAKEKEKI